MPFKRDDPDTKGNHSAVPDESLYFAGDTLQGMDHHPDGNGDVDLVWGGYRNQADD